MFSVLMSIDYSLRIPTGQSFETSPSRGTLSIFYEADASHGQGDFGVLHEPVPNLSRAHVFGAQEDYAGVDADHVRVDPAGLRVEGVDEAVLAVDFGAVLFMHGQ